MNRLLTIVETKAYLAAAKGVLNEDDRVMVIDMIAENPVCGEVIEGTGGIRKARYALGNRGKSAGSRIIYFYHSENHPAFLLTVFAKNEKTSLSKAEKNRLKQLVKELIG